jgi:hypothetical protein
VDGGSTRVHVMDINGARRRSHELTAARPELGLGWQESTHRWTGTPCRVRVARLLTRGVRRESPPGRGWTGLRAEAYGGPDRAGLRSKMYRWRSVTQLCQQPTVTVFFRSRLRPFTGQSEIVIELRFHAMDSTITYDTTSCLCAKCSTRFNTSKSCGSAIVGPPERCSPMASNSDCSH